MNRDGDDGRTLKMTSRSKSVWKCTKICPKVHSTTVLIGKVVRVLGVVVVVVAGEGGRGDIVGGGGGGGVGVGGGGGGGGGRGGGGERRRLGALSRQAPAPAPAPAATMGENCMRQNICLVVL